ncbi:MAG: PAS domain S-box protein [Chloroflexaceae bacterium]|nr:PAS domain S-box protein [Chloroflexaceae bacterium]
MATSIDINQRAYYHFLVAQQQTLTDSIIHDLVDQHPFCTFTSTELLQSYIGTILNQLFDLFVAADQQRLVLWMDALIPPWLSLPERSPLPPWMLDFRSRVIILVRKHIIQQSLTVTNQIVELQHALLQLIDLCDLAEQINRQKKSPGAPFRTNQTTQQGQELVQLMSENVQDFAIMVLDPGGYVTSWNIGAERIYGYSSHEIIGQHVSLFYPPDMQVMDSATQNLVTVARQSRFSTEQWRMRRDKSLFWADITVNALYDHQGYLRGFIKMIRDITYRKQMEDLLREKETHFRLVFEDGPLGIFISNMQGQILKANKAFCTMMQYDEETLCQYTLQDIVHPDDANWYRTMIEQEQRASDSQIYRLEQRYYDRYKAIIWANVTISMVRDHVGKPIYVLGF